MDLNAVLGKFFDSEGAIALPSMLSLAGLAEMAYQMRAAGGQADERCMRFWDYSDNPEGTAVDYTHAQINTRIKAVAARLQQVTQPGERVAIMANNSPEYIYGFLGAMFAATIPVPLYDPNEPGHANHLSAVFADCRPSVVLTNKRSAAGVRAFFAERPGTERPRILAVDALPDATAQAFQAPSGTPEALDLPAFLQYTSGSTRTPAGVILTNRSILTNVLQIFLAADVKLPVRFVSWLPLHHDMGIILALFVTILGLPHEFMAPRDFVQQPSRWIRQIDRQSPEERIYTVVPNFALELASRYGEVDGVDLSAVENLLCGSEPITENAVQSFVRTFEPHGFPRAALRPGYGLAEASLLVSLSQTEAGPIIAHFDRDELAGNIAAPTDRSENTVALTSNGQAVPMQFCTIVDPESRSELPDGQIGEIWVQGENMAAGYFNRDEETAQSFHNQLAKKLPDSRVATAPEDGHWMATGDLGALIDGELFITGRLKDLIVIAGRNHYPQDVEHTVSQASQHIRPNCVAAFAVSGEDVEKLVVLAERDLGTTEAGDADAIQAIRAAVTEAHGVQPYDIRISAPDTIARSSSGKIARRVCQQNYLQQV